MKILILTAKNEGAEICPKRFKKKEFAGASKYVLDDELARIVNISMALEMPLLLKGEPGTGKTMLAHAIAETFEMRLIVLNVKSSMKLDRCPLPVRHTHSFE